MADHRADLQRQDAQDLELTVVDEEMRAASPASAAVPLLLPYTSGTALRVEGGHRRNRSADARVEERERGSFVPRKSSAASDMSASPARVRARLSDTRRVDLPLPFEFPSRPASPPQQSSSPIRYVTHNSSVPRTADESAVVDVSVYFPDPSATLPSATDDDRLPSLLVLRVTGGKLASASFLLKEVAHEFNVDEALVEEAISVWMGSDLLEVQLKPHHCAYDVNVCWQEFLRKYTAASEEEILGDAPLIVLRRRVQLSVEREREIIATCPFIREILFNDAYEKLRDGRYFLEVHEAVHLAGLSLAALCGPFHKERHSLDFLRQELDNFVPAHLVSAVRGPLLFGRAWSAANSLETTFLDAWAGAPSEPARVHLKMLHQLHEKPDYGAAFFPGWIERPKKKWSLSKTTQLKVLVAITHSFISVMDEAKHERLLVQKIEACHWSRVDFERSQLEAGMEPSLLLHFPDESGAHNTKMLQIFGRQAVMMDALLRGMQTRQQKERLDSGHETDGSAGAVSARVSSSSSVDSPPSPPSPPSSPSSPSSPVHRSIDRVPSITRSNKLCLATFDPQGKCISAQGSLKPYLLRSLC